MECGLSTSTGFGAASIAWSEIVAWQTATGNDGLWIASTVKSLSVAYTNELTLAKDPTRASPLQEDVDKTEQRKAVSNQLKSLKGQ